MPIVQAEYETEHVTFSLIRQGKFRFYSLTLAAKVLASTCFVSTRYDDPLEGFQRTLDKARAQSIAEYIDSGQTIPVAIILSAQSEAALEVKRGGGRSHLYVIRRRS